MKLTKLTKVALVLTAMITSTAYASLEQAEEACISEVIHGGYEKPGSIRTENLGHDTYRIKGTVYSKDDRKRHNFKCKYRHGELVDWNVAWPSNDKKVNNKVAIGAGILAIAAIAAAANNDKSKDHAAGGSPFNDRRYLKRECRHNLKHHIEMAKKVRLTSAHLQSRRLSGEGFVTFDDGYERSLTYSCDFDRRGRIHDGNYHFGRR